MTVAVAVTVAVTVAVAAAALAAAAAVAGGWVFTIERDGEGLQRDVGVRGACSRRTGMHAQRVRAVTDGRRRGQLQAWRRRVDSLEVLRYRGIGADGVGAQAPRRRGACGTAHGCGTVVRSDPPSHAEPPEPRWSC